MSPVMPDVLHLTNAQLNTEIIPLWPSVMNPDGEEPSLAVYLPEAGVATSSAVVICPGGGYGFLANDHEGVQIARWLNARGVAAFVLRYRHAPHRHPAPLMDAQRAMRIARMRAEEWNVDPMRIGVWGFSAGGHLAATLSTHFDMGNALSDDPLERISCRPDFAILSYPVISMQPPYCHVGSRRNLLGDYPDLTLVETLCCERQVTADTPPTFLFHTGNDPVVPVENSLLYYRALREAGVPAEMHLYADGPHGVGLCLNDPVLGTWPARLYDWLRGMKMA